MDIQPYVISIGDDQLADLQQRLERVRWPMAFDGSWEDGASLVFMRRLIDHWRYRFDWRMQEARLNRLPHFMTSIDDVEIHFVHQHGSAPAPLSTDPDP